MKAAFHTLGCKVNQYETESMKEQFSKAGFEIVDEGAFADVYVINTCTVTNLADRKSRQFIRRSLKRNSDAVVAVTGCYAQIKPDDVANIEGVSIVTGTDEKSAVLPLVQKYMEEHGRNTEGHDEVLSAVKEYSDLSEYENLGSISGMEGRNRAFIKIQEGCTHFCTYCIIPYARGNIRSRKKEDVVAEVKQLIDKGYKEIVLTGINTAYYGKDLGYDGAAELIGELNDTPGDFRIRLSSLEPTVIDAEYVKKLFPYEKLCHHLHLALQSGSDNVLTAMNRGYTQKEFMAIADELRKFDPNYGLSTDIIVGFPGETEEDFMESEKVVTEAAFCKTHVFKYSMRSGTPAAKRNDQVDGAVKADRSHRLIECSERAKQDFFKACIGDERVVLVEQFVQDPITGESQGMEESEDNEAGIEINAAEGRQLLTGYTDNYIRTYFVGTPDLFNQFVKVKLVKPYKDGMLGEIAE